MLPRQSSPNVFLSGAVARAPAGDDLGNWHRLSHGRDLGYVIRAKGIGGPCAMSGPAQTIGAGIIPVHRAGFDLKFMELAAVGFHFGRRPAFKISRVVIRNTPVALARR